MKIYNLQQANDILSGYIPAVREMTGKDITLKRMEPLMKMLGNPEAKLKIIHIAGTSGKTSTAYYMAAMLQATGKKVGLTVSPHVTSVTERVQINLQPLSESEFCARLGEFLELIKDTEPQPTYFELLVAFAYWYFATKEVDYAVIETGLGGLHDATNIAGQPDKVCIITDIGYDHTKVLGNTLTKIATQKGGIIHAHNDVFCYTQSAPVMKVLRKICDQRQAKLHEIVPLSNGGPSSELPLFQRRNWCAALTAYEFIAKRDSLPVLSKLQLGVSVTTKIPARMETIAYGGKTIILDGAHNPQKLQALASAVRDKYPGVPIGVMAGFVRNNRPRIVGNLRQLVPIVNRLVITSFVPNQEMHTASEDPQQIATFCEKIGFHAWEIADKPETAFRRLLSRPEPVLLVTGSFYLMHYVRPLIMDGHD